MAQIDAQNKAEHLHHSFLCDCHIRLEGSWGQEVGKAWLLPHSSVNSAALGKRFGEPSELQYGVVCESSAVGASAFLRAAMRAMWLCLAVLVFIGENQIRWVWCRGSWCLVCWQKLLLCRWLSCQLEAALQLPGLASAPLNLTSNCSSH